MPLSKKRRTSLLGTRVLVCGVRISKEHNLVCLLPTNIRHRTHVTVAVTEENHLLLAFRETGSKEIEWQPVSVQVEPSMSQEPQ